MSRSILSNASIVVAGRFIGFALQFLTAAIMARLLSPEEFGLFAVAAGLAAMLYALREFGVTNFLIRSEHLDAALVGSVFGVSFFLSFVLGATLAVAAPELANWYGDARLLPLVYLLAVNFFVYPFGTLCITLLQREERFAEVVRNNLASAASSAAVSLLLALAGAGPVALVLGVATNSLVTLALGLWSRPAGLTFRPSLRHVRQVLSFGGWLTGVSVATQLAERASELIIGKTLGLAAAGLFDKGVGMVRLFQQSSASIIQVVVFSAMAREQREGNNQASVFFYRIAILSGLLWPLFIFLCCNAHPLILLVFGAQWVEVAPAASLLALNAMLMAPFLLGDQVLIVRNRVRALFFQRLVLFVLKVLVLLLVSPFGLTPTAAALLLPTVAYLYLNLRAVLAELDSDWAPLGIALRGSLALGGSSAAVGLVTIRTFGFAGDDKLLTRLAFAVVATALAWLLVSILVRGPVADVRQRLFAAGEGILRRAIAKGRRRLIDGSR